MVKRPDIPTWQRNAERLIEVYLDINTGEIDDVFNEHIQYLRDNIDTLDDTTYPPNLYPSLLTTFMRHFSFPTEMKALLRHYIKTNTIDLSLVRPPIAVIDERDNTYRLNIDDIDQEEYWEEYPDQKDFKLVIPNGTRTSEIIEFIRKEKAYIDEQLGNSDIPKKKKKEAPSWIAIRVVNLHRQGMSNDKIVKKARHEDWESNAFGPDDVAAILRRTKNQH
jgi:hypothetical protein